MCTGFNKSINLTLIFLLALIIGCSSGGTHEPPVVPDNPDLTAASEQTQPSENSHALLLYNLIYIDPYHPDGPQAEIIPLRQGEIHLNILKFLEDGPCFNCFKIVGFNVPEPGILDVDIQIDHPFDDLDLSVFDVRGIMMFSGSHAFPASGKSISDPDLGDGALLNADGYTALYNGNTMGAPVGGLQKYYEGNFATPEIPNADINGYKYYVTDTPANNRNAFYADSSDIQTFSLKLPTGPFVLGYAVDANWWPPIESPVDDPLTDFDLDANCPEPWKIVVTEEPIGDGLTDQGGSTKLTIDVYDWQGKDTHHDPVVECPELFDGQLTATWDSSGPGYARYEVTISNDKLADVGEFWYLLGVEANENNPSGTPWLDLTAYQTQTLTVIETPTQNPVAIAEADPNPQTAGLPVHFSAVDSYDPDGGDIQLYEWDWENNGSFDESGCETDFMWDIAGTYYVQLRVTDDESETDILDDPLEITITEHQPPEACGEAEPLSTVVCEPVHFTDCGSVAYDGAEIVLHEWDWDNDGVYDEEGTALYHTWDIPGIYFVQYRVTDDQGASDELDSPIEIMVVGDIPFNLVDVTPPWLNFCPNDVCNDGNYAYVAGGDNGLHIFDISNPANPLWVNRVIMPGTTLGVFVSNGYAYVADGFSGLQIIDIDPPESAYIVNGVDTTDKAICVAISGEYAYMANSMYDGTNFYIIDIDPPEDAFIVKTITTPDSGSKDIEVAGGYAYVADGHSGLQIIDIEPPEAAYIVKTVELPENAYGVAVSGDYAYVADNNAGLQIIDIEPPESAYIANSVDTLGYARGVDVSNGYAYVADSNYGLQIIDIEPPGDAYLVKTVDTGRAEEVTVSNGYAYVADIESGLQIVDIEPANAAYIVGGVDTPLALDVAVSSGYAYVVYFGLKIIDIEPPDSAYVVNAVHTNGTMRSVAVSDGYAYLGNDNNCLQIVDIEPPESAYITKTVNTTEHAQGVIVSGDYAYVATGDDLWDGSLHIIDIDPPESAHIVKTVDTGHTGCVTVSDGYAYMGSIYSGFLIVDIEPLGSAYIVKTIDTLEHAYNIDVSNGYAYVADYQDGLQIIDIQPPESAYIVKTVDTYSAQDVTVSGGYAYVADDFFGGLQIIDIEPPESAYIVNSIDTPGYAFGIALSSNYAYVADVNGFRIIQLY